MTKILVVEDDQFFREAVCDTLKKRLYEVYEAPNGQIAKEIMSIQDFDMVLSDIQMPLFTGIDLLQWAKANKPVPFILMTGFSMLLETQSAYELGASEFLAKPFKNAELFQAIEKVVGKKSTATESTADDYCRVSIDEFIARPKTEFDVYVMLGGAKFIKISNTGNELDKDRLVVYKSKGVKYLYFLKKDFSKLIASSLNVAKLVKDKSDISNEKKINFMKYTGDLILEKLHATDLDREIIADSQIYLATVVDVLTDNEDNFDLLQSLNSYSDQVYAHSLCVSMFSILIAKQLGLQSTVTISKISAAALFHDIGKKEIEKEILEKPRHKLTVQERKQYESHTLRGKEILLSLRTMHDDIVQLVYEHHEDLEGQGYPQAINKKKLHPLSKIVNLANLFAEQVITSPQHPGLPGKEALTYIEKVYATRVCPESLKALKQIFKVT